MPTVWLQQRLWDAGHLHWYDYAAWGVYMTHFFAVWVTAAVLWRVARDALPALRGDRGAAQPRGLRDVLGLSGPAAVAGGRRAAHPARRPDRADGVGPPRRADGQSIYENSDFVNTVAAMPSLHAAFPLMLLLFFWSAGRWVRLGLGPYTLAMAFTLVYGGEHFVADIVAGWAMALGVHALVSVGFRRAPALLRAEAPHGERLRHVRGRAVAGVDVDLARLDDELAAVVVEAEVARVERERDRLRLARRRASPARSRAAGAPAARCSPPGRGCRAARPRRPRACRCW